MPPDIHEFCGSRSERGGWRDPTGGIGLGDTANFSFQLVGTTLDDLTAAPEPGALLLLGGGLTALAMRRRRPRA
jgi:hypothetical protein